MKHQKLINWLESLPSNKQISWKEYCRRAGISNVALSSREYNGYLIERNTLRNCVNEKTRKMTPSFTMKPRIIYPNTAAGSIKRVLVKVDGTDQVHEQIRHYDKRVSKTHENQRRIMRELRSDPTLPKATIDLLDRVTYATDVVNHMFEQSIQLALNSTRYTKLANTSVKRLTEEGLDLADERKKQSR